MKSANDPRHVKRRRVVKELFAESFTAQPLLSKTASFILKHSPKYDKQITLAAPKWSVDKLNKVDLAILRYAVYELKKGITPTKVVIDEAVEIAKELGSESSPPFVNGVLGAIVNKDTYEE